MELSESKESEWNEGRCTQNLSQRRALDVFDRAQLLRHPFGCVRCYLHQLNFSI